MRWFVLAVFATIACSSNSPGASGGAGGASGAAGADASAGAGAAGGAATGGVVGSDAAADAVDVVDALWCGPGDRRSCTCGGGGPFGVETCLSDGSAYSPCDCDGGAPTLGSCTQPIPISVQVGLDQYSSDTEILSQVSAYGAFPTSCSDPSPAWAVHGVFVAPHAGTWALDGSVQTSSKRGVVAGSACDLGPTSGACDASVAIALQTGESGYVVLDVPTNASGSVTLTAHYVGP